MRFKKVYVEITNACNFSCSFCYKSNRKKQFISPEVFSAILVKLKPFTDYLYLHVLGEPLLHPDVETLLNIAFRMGFRVNITTNGSLLSRFADSGVIDSVRQFNVSLHDAEENVDKQNIGLYLKDICDFVAEHSANSYFSLRLWNQGVDEVDAYNRFCLDFLSDYFSVDFSDDVFSVRNVKIRDHVFLQNSARFEWPGAETTYSKTNHSCQALRDHIAVLVDGRVVPCCLDADANLCLGNILEDDLNSLLLSAKALDIKEGFQKREARHQLCQHCGFYLSQ